MSDESSLIKSSSVDIESPIVIVRLGIDEQRFIDVFRNFETGTLSYTLIGDDERLYSVDNDSVRGWHEHPFEEPENHDECDPKQFQEFMEKVENYLEQ